MPAPSKQHNPASTIVYSYIRFVQCPQFRPEGDSVRRQSERAAEYCQRRGWVLDETLTLRDLGVSAFKGSNAAVGNFRTFLDAVQEGRVVPGSVLLVESFDRISRQGIDEGYDLIKSILKAGVKIVTLSPNASSTATQPRASRAGHWKYNSSWNARPRRANGSRIASGPPGVRSGRRPRPGW